MPKYLFFSIGLTLALGLLVVGNRDFTVFGYVPEYRYGGVDWDAAAAHVTHLILFSLEVSPKGEIVALDRFPDPESYAKVREAAQKHGTKVLICFGGNSRSNGFSAVVQNDKIRATFLRNLLWFINEHKLDGWDANWEYPQTEGDWTGLHKLLLESKNMLKPKGGLVTMAFYPGQETILRSFVDVVDYFHMMSYDSHGQHSTMDFAIKATQDALKYLPRKKLTMGVPFYARHTRSGTPKTYGEMRDMSGGNISPNVDEIASYYFNGFDTMKKKTQFALKQEIGGVMIWEVGQDIHPSNKFALLNAITEARNEFKVTKKGSDDEL